MANDFMNWRISTSLRLFGIPHKKNSAVTRTKGRRWPAGKREPCAFSDVSVFPVVETCILRFSLDFETGFRRLSAGQPTPSRQAKIFVKREGFSPHRHLTRFFLTRAFIVSERRERLTVILRSQWSVSGIAEMPYITLP